MTENVQTAQSTRRKYLFLIWVMCTFIAYVQQQLAGLSSTDPIQLFAQALGGSLMIYGIPYLFLLTLSKPLKYGSKKYLICLTVACLLIGFMTINGTMYERKTSTAKSNVGIDKDFQFGGNEFQVTFPSEPEIKQMAIPFGDQIYEGQQAFVKLSNNAILKAEYFEFPSSDSSAIDKDFAYNTMNQYAKFNGIEKIEMTFDQNDLGKIGYLRGFKSLETSSGNRKTTYEIRNIIGKKSMLILYAGGASENYPQAGIVEFFKSIEKHK